ncbi:isocitrate lyase/phosphoenolpyruvate mutase family protein [Mucilaginibacter sabulilitoris]|uniref:Isocitrate lyase/phosphoenolpyruvate mutase family protein n=1 Tax=Mucilaginibacter sabulilitoris TaxID=1173583 RepID=A0ABZ0TV46_9SPHI|nr:isocitrate lyase/phosphoenolpyruvate mutase family protein [Mucilaginibacter sabulilitoris]WPU96636.1 isocitrate lyase/phosphoenolpyruvate mutase family protein [Mucilaginibacter sabulilitoris]
MNAFETFAQLHQNSTPFLIGNIWDVNSAKLFEASGYKAIATSSQALANSFGYDDGEKLPFEILLQLAKRVVEVVQIPFSVDIEGGYSRTIEGITANISKLHDAGVVGINLEDTLPGAPRQLQSVNEFEKILSAVADYISQNNLQLFLNVRTDGFLLGMPTALNETLVRIKSYESSGANGVFVPCITSKDDIKQVVEATKLPVNVMCMPNLPDFAELGELGVKRISMGSFLFSKVYDSARQLLKSIDEDNNFSSIL